MTFKTVGNWILEALKFCWYCIWLLFAGLFIAFLYLMAGVVIPLVVVSFVFLGVAFVVAAVGLIFLI